MIGSAGENSTQSIAAGPTPRTRREQLAFWRQERARVRRLMANPGYGSDFDRATFLLSKQLVYFDRYGKQYLPETPLMHDSEAYRAILALPLR